MVAAVSLVDIDTLDLAAGEPLSGFDDGAQRVAVIRIAGQRPGVQNKLATRCPGIGGDDGSFHSRSSTVKAGASLMLSPLTVVMVCPGGFGSAPAPPSDAAVPCDAAGAAGWVT